MAEPVFDEEWEFVGAGKYKDVYRGQWHERANVDQEKVVAISIIVSDDKAIQNEEMRGALMMKELDVPCVQKVYDVIDDHGTPVILSELCNQGSLKQFTQSHTNLWWEKRLEICRQCLEGLIQVHAKGIVHHDVSWRNVLLHEEGDKIAAYLSDFSFACYVDQLPDAIPKEFNVIVAPPELSKEGSDRIQAWGAPAYDVWSAGLLIYQLFSGFTIEQLPWYEAQEHFTSQDPKETAWALKEFTTKKEEIFCLDFSAIESKELIYLILDMMHPNPSFRLTAEQARTRLMSIK